MSDEELRRVMHELDAALQVIRRQSGEEREEDDVAVQTGLAEIRRELAMYRVILQTRAQHRRP